MWEAIIADPGMKKTILVNKAVRPLERVDREWRDEDRIAHDHYDLQKKIHDAKLKKYITAEAKHEGDTPPIEPVRPPRRRTIINDATSEALSEILQDNPRGVLVKRDELTGWVTSFDKYRDGAHGADRSAAIETYGGGPYTIDRINRGTVHVSSTPRAPAARRRRRHHRQERGR